MFFENCSFLVVFGAYLRSKCTTPDEYMCDCADLVVIHSLRTALGSLKEEEEEEEERRKKKEDEQCVWAAILVYCFRDVCRLRQWYFHVQDNRLINPRCSESRETL